MPFAISPSVNVSEIDNSTVIPSSADSVGAISGEFSWGPVNKRIRVESEPMLVSTFGTPTSNNYSTFFSAANYLAYSNNLLVVRAANTTSSFNASTNQSANISIGSEKFWEVLYQNSGNTSITGGPFAARYPGTFGNSIAVAVCGSNTAFKFSNTSITANTIVGSNTIVLNSNTLSYFSNFTANDYITVNGVQYVLDSTPAQGANTIIAKIGTSAAPATANNVSVKLAWKYAQYFSSAPSTSIYAGQQGALNDEISIVVIDANGTFSGTKGTILETYDRLSVASDAVNDDGSNNYYQTILFNKSKYIYAIGQVQNTNWNQPALNTTFLNVANYYNQLAGGSNVIDSAAKINGYSHFTNSDEVTVDFLIAGEADTGTTPEVVTSILTLANQRKDCVAFISPLRQDSITSTVNLDKIISYRNTLSPSTSYSFMDSGYKYQYDKYNNVYRYVPLNGDMAGLCARTDKTNAPWWSPAGLNRGQLLNAIKLSWNPSQPQRDELYQANINPVISLSGQGIVLYGDKTMQSKTSSFDRINVRRLFITLERAIATASKYSLFEFNDSFTQSAFISLVDPYLRSVKAGRGIYNYRVVCDASNNPPSVVDQNGFVGDIYIQPAKSINFIQLNFTAVNGGVSFSEISGSTLTF